MAPMGYSTGSLALGEFRLGLQMVAGEPTTAVELSALREGELEPLLESLDELDLGQFGYIAVHAPSRLEKLTEREVVDLLRDVAAREWPVIVHPDVVTRPEVWADLGEWCCIENMDKRKPRGRSARELAREFGRLPEATWCFDIGHARQVDPTMCEAALMLQKFRNRLRQIHISTVGSASQHEPLGFLAIRAFREVAHMIPEDIPAILETPVSQDRLHSQVLAAAEALGRSPSPV